LFRLTPQRSDDPRHKPCPPAIHRLPIYLQSRRENALRGAAALGATPSSANRTAGCRGGTLPNRLLAPGLGPRFRGLGPRPVRAARRSRKAGDPSGRPIVPPAQRGHRLVRGRRVDQVDEPEVASLQERRDGRERIVARGQMRANARPAPVLRTRRRAGAGFSAGVRAAAIRRHSSMTIDPKRHRNSAARRALRPRLAAGAASLTVPICPSLAEPRAIAADLGLNSLGVRLVVSFRMGNEYAQQSISV
jgi:hypothetical protein